MTYPGRTQRRGCAACADDADTNSAFVARVFQSPRPSNQRRSNQRRSKPHSYPTAPMSGTRRPNFIEHLGTQNRATEPARIQEHSRRRQIILAELCKEFHPKVKLRSDSRPNLENTNNCKTDLPRTHPSLQRPSRQSASAEASSTHPNGYRTTGHSRRTARAGSPPCWRQSCLWARCLLFPTRRLWHALPDHDMSDSCVPVPAERVRGGRKIRFHSARM